MAEDTQPLVEKLTEFFETKLLEKIEDLAAAYPMRRSLAIDYAELEKFDPDLADELLESPDKVVAAAEAALAGMGATLPLLPGTKFTPHARFHNLPDKSLLIQDIGSAHIEKLVCVKGVITKRTEVWPKVMIAFYECAHCGNGYKVPLTRKGAGMSACEECRRPVRLREDKSYFVDFQRAEAQELLERLHGGAPASHLQLDLEDDLVNTFVPGDTIEITGIVRIRPPLLRKGSHASGTYLKYLDVMHVESVQRKFEEVEVSKEEEKRIRELAKDPEIFEKITRSIAPSIYGHDEVKQAIALQLFGATPDKELPEGGRIRSDIHILLIGDPGAAKSRFLQYVKDLAPKSIYVSGKSVSGVGLCVAGDSLVQLNDAGLLRIGELVEANFNKGIEELPGAFSCAKPSRVVAVRPDLKIAFCKGSKIWRIKPPSHLIHLTTQRGKSLRVTPHTPVLVLEDSEVVWKRAGELTGREFIATTRALPPLTGRPIALVSLLAHPHVRVAAPIAEWFKLAAGKLVQKYGDLTRASTALGIRREQLYEWKDAKRSRGASIAALKTIAAEAGMPVDSLASFATSVFVRHGRPHRLPPTLTPDLCYFAGLMAGDGDVSWKGSTASVRFHCKDVEFLKRVQLLVSNLFGIRARIEQSRNRIPCLRFGSLVVAELLEKLGVPSGEKSHRVDIPVAVTSSGVDNVRAFLKGLFDTDGWVARPRGRGSASVGLTTASEPLAQKLLLLLEWWGILAKLRCRDKRGATALLGGKKVITKRLQYQIEIRGVDNIRRFRDAIGFSRTEKRAALDQLLSACVTANPNLDLVPITRFLSSLKRRYLLSERVLPTFYCRGTNAMSRERLARLAGFIKEKPEAELLHVLASSDIYWDRLSAVSKEPCLDEWVYDFTVEGSHAFAANGIIVHNTASAERDELGEGGWVLKAGALVLASGGIASIDEFDKIDDAERGALHEVMESGTVSIAKAGIVARFKAETSIIAAANPKFGRFDPNKYPADQFEIPPTLLSRFDLIFPIKDILDEEKDRRLADHLLASHTAASDRRALEKLAAERTPINSVLLRKYIAFARKHFRPVLTPEANARIKDYYVELRKLGQAQGSIPITPRQIEGLIRLSEASAKSRLSPRVEVVDAERAIRLIDFVLRSTALDRSTGKLDIDIWQTGVPKSRADMYSRIMRIAEELQREFDLVEIKELIRLAKEEGIDENTAERFIQERVDKGEFYKPKHGYIKIIKRTE
ncbi:MAG: LAGLIDADG family homing endonuclease [Candidatus Micrarchaeia archaeon]